MELIRGFKEISKADAAIAGGKGASLGEMTQAGIPVPPGFVITSAAFDQFLKEADLVQEIEAALRLVNHAEMHTVERASETIQGLILAAEIPADIRSGIEQRFKELDTPYVAVRSSATAEDGQDHAWAGQLDSYLNTTGQELLTNVRRCWASLFTPRAIFYRFEKGLHTTDISVAVVVQKMVESEISGIAFSVHPVTEDRNQLIIEAGFGLGEAIVSGQVTPDSYVVEKEPHKILDKNVYTQNRALYRVEKGGNEWRSISEPLASSQVLTDAQILELSELVLRIENHYGFPCDIEWAFERGQFYIVQSRPITTLGSAAPKAIYRKVYTRENCLIAIQIWEEHQVHLLKEKVGMAVPLSVFDAYEGVVRVYYREDIDDIWGGIIKDRAVEDSTFVPELMNWYGKQLDTLEGIWKKGSVSGAQGIADLFKLASWSWVGLSISYCLPSTKGVTEAEQELGMKLRERSADFLELTDHVIQNTLHTLYPELGDLVKYLTIDEVRENTLPSIEELKKRERHYIYYDFKLYTDVEIGPFVAEQGIVIREERIHAKAGELSGQTAMGGMVRGTVRVLHRKADIPLLQEGEILVTAMTTPDYLPAMHKAVGFITDEGGITCHAAIVARELGKPCVIGTVVATQALKDGDEVEVDADNGLIRILKKAYTSADYYLLFHTNGVNFLFTDLCTKYYDKFNGVTLSTHNQWRYYVHLTERAKAEDAYQAFYKDVATVEESSARLLKAKEALFLSRDALAGVKEVTLKIFDDFVSQAAILLDEYARFDHMYTDYLFKDDRKEVPDLIQQVQEKKNVFREYTNQIFFNEDGYMRQLVTRISAEKNIPVEQLLYASADQIRRLLSEGSFTAFGKDGDDYALIRDQGRFTYFFGNRAQQFIEGFIVKEDISTLTELKGISVSKKGVYTGTIKKIVLDYSNLQQGVSLLAQVPAGIVLLTESTVPEMLNVMSRSLAIVTDEGGMLSHAAITSRELGIPCVIGTRIATQVFRDGDTVEVNADTGVVRKL